MQLVMLCQIAWILPQRSNSWMIVAVCACTANSLAPLQTATVLGGGSTKQMVSFHPTCLPDQADLADQYGVYGFMFYHYWWPVCMGFSGFWVQGWGIQVKVWQLASGCSGLLGSCP